MNELLFNTDQRCMDQVIQEALSGKALAQSIFANVDLVGETRLEGERYRQLLACRRCSLLCGVYFDPGETGKIYPSDRLNGLKEVCLYPKPDRVESYDFSNVRDIRTGKPPEAI